MLGAEAMYAILIVKQCMPFYETRQFFLVYIKLWYTEK